MNNIFGSNYEEFGSSNSNLILKTKGKIKIQWGNKFIDLLDNNGNINSGISKVIKEISSVNLISKDGLYYVIDDQSLIALVNGKQIVISSNSENTYVSFVTDLEPSEDEKITALHNIGFYYDNLSEVKSFLKGIIYVEDLKSLYIISDGKITKYLADIENPYPRRFVIYKNSLEEEGALVIKGEGSNNGIKFNSLNIFSEDESSIFESEGKIIFNASQGIRSDRIESIVADSSSGYRLYSINGESTLEVDNLVVRKNNTSNGSNDNLDILPIEYFKLENILVEITRDNLDLYFLKVKYISNYLVNDILSTFYNLNDELVQVKLKILEKINDLSYRIELVSTTYNLLKIKNKVIGLVDDDLVIGKTGNIYNSKDYGIISKLNLFYSTKFDKEGTGESIFPFYSDSLYTYLSGLSYKNTTTYDKILTPLGVIKSLPFVGSASYVSNDKKIYFYDYYGNQLCYIDATDFIKDGMVSDVRIENRNLIVDFNTDSGIQDITIPLSDIFDPDLWQPKITSTNKLLSDLVDDTNQTHLFVTSTEKSTWNGKLDAISDLSTIRSNATNGNTAYGWGNHANAGYALASALNNYLPLTGGTITTNDLNIETNLVFTKGGTNQNRTFSFKRTLTNTNIDIGWDWTNKDGAGFALRSVDATNQSGNFYIWARDSAGTTCLLEGHPDGTLTWGGNTVYHSGNLPAYPTTLPASDVYAWAKAATKPSYTLDEVSDGSTRKLANYLPLSGGTLTNNTNDVVLGLASNYTNVWMSWTPSDSTKRYLGVDTSNKLKFQYGGHSYKVWHEGNDGSGSGLDSDLLDGQHGSYYAAASSLSNYLPLAGGTMTGGINFSISGSNRNAVALRKSVYEQQFGWKWDGFDGAGLGVYNSDAGGTDKGCFFLYTSNGSNHVYYLNGRPDGTLTWGGNGIIHAGNIGSQSVAYATNAGNIAEEFSDESEVSFRPTAGAVDVSSGKAGKGAKLMAVKGNTVVWNQLVESSSSGNSGSLTDDRNYFFPQLWYRTIGATETSRLKNLETHQLSESNFNISSIFTFEGVNNVTGITFKHDGAHRNIYMFSAFGLVVGHKYLVSCFIETCDTSSNSGLKWRNGAVIDLTLIYGSGNEPETAAAFEADYQRWFGKPLTYEEYDAGSLRPVKMTGIKTVGFNAWDEEWRKAYVRELDDINNIAYTGEHALSYPINVLPNTQYYLYKPNNAPTLGYCVFYDASGKFISDINITASDTGQTILTPANCFQILIQFNSSYSVINNYKFCLNIRHSGARNGEYEPYWTSMLNVPVTTLKGKLNGEGNSVVVFPDGMKKAGSVYDEIVRRGDKTYAIKRVVSYTFDGNENTAYSDTSKGYFLIQTPTAEFEGGPDPHQSSFSRYLSSTDPNINVLGNKTLLVNSGYYSSYGKNIIIRDTSFSKDNEGAAQLLASLVGTTIFVALYTPEEYLLDDFELPQEYDVDDYGTEEVQLGINGVAPLLDLKYGINAADTIKNLPHSYVSAIGEQSFTEAQKARARKNIGAVEQNEFDSLSETIAAALVDLNNKVDGVETLLSQI